MRKTFIVLLFFSSVLACTVSERISKINFNYLYKQTIADNAPKFVAYFVDANTCRVYYKIPPGALAYKKDDKSEEYIANFRLSFKMFESYKAKNLLDSVNLSFIDTNKLQQPKTIEGNIDIKKPELDKSILKINFYDKNRQARIENFLIINSKVGSRYYFLLEDSLGRIVFNNYIYEGKFSLRTSLDIEKLNVNIYQRDFPIAKAPFAVNDLKPFDYKPDSSYQIGLEKGRSATIELNNNGFYHFQVDTARKEGITIFKYYQGFPNVVKTEQLLEPLKYISSSKEFKAIVRKPNLKKAIDEFWIELAGNPVRAKAMIQEYYTRVEEANLLFSSYTEGWKTDKGMVYIVFGMPKAVFKDVEVEEWIYGETFHPKAINFYFVKVINPFTDSDYYLTRNKSYKDSWYMAVERTRR